MEGRSGDVYTRQHGREVGLQIRLCTSANLLGGED